LVRKRYDTLNLSFLSFLQQISERCAESATRLSFCGEDAGRLIEAAAFAAIGITNLSMRPASIGPVKHMLLKTNLENIREAIKQAHEDGAQSARKYILEALSKI
jgi:phosphotransferase system enzyme I (PtsP)